MIGQNTFRYSLIAAVIIAILTLTGIFTIFDRRDVIAEVLTQSLALFFTAIGGTAYLVAQQSSLTHPRDRILNAVIGAGIAVSVVIGLILLSSSVNLSFVFPQFRDLTETSLIFRQENPIIGVVELFTVSLFLGAAVGIVASLAPRTQSILFAAIGLTAMIGLLQNDIRRVMTIADAVSLFAVFALSFEAMRRSNVQPLVQRILFGLAIGIGSALILVLIANSGALASGGWLRPSNKIPLILNLAVTGQLLSFVAVFGVIGMAGAVISRTPLILHNAAWSLLIGFLALGVISWQDEMNLFATVIIFALISGGYSLLPQIGRNAEARFLLLPHRQRDSTRLLVVIFALGVMAFVPLFAGLSISNTINLTMLYITMGIGLSVMIGYAGLLDLGYVASYAIGAYTIGLLTTPSMLTCGGLSPDQISEQGLNIATTCTGVMTFFEGLPFAVIVSALTGMLLGVPVLRLRGDYLAIVTLGFGEIIQSLVRSSTFAPLLGGPQGIIQIPLPTVDLSIFNPTWNFTLQQSTEVYYLYIFAVGFAAIVVLRLINTRLGRAWRAMREDEDVAEAMGIHLVWTKLRAFGISSAFAGLGGAVFGATYQSIFPGSFTLAVSINVLSLIIIGGMGSIPGVVLGAVILIGLPEILRELQDYRLLAFGVLLVVTMLLRPEGLLPPQAPRLSERASHSPAPTGD
ncbi:MAG: hypothetical protein MUF87_13435 [Anaerolineae bacterium]|jgi:branched-chain amino acid transport system permease protein|nr:hypothetical protein [Anaerolineae bacterium]